MSQKNDTNSALLCRLCLTKCNFNFSLFTGNIVEQILSLTSIEISSNDNLPQICCENCLANLHTSYRFQQLIIESDRKLRMLPTEGDVIEHAKNAQDTFEIMHDECLFDETEDTPEFKIETIDVCETQDDDVFNNLSKLFETDDKNIISGDTKDVKCKLEVYNEGESSQGTTDTQCRKIEFVTGSPRAKLRMNDDIDEKLGKFMDKQIMDTLKCEECDRIFENKRVLQRHKMKHKLEVCPYCSITMRCDNLKRHIQIHTDSPEICEICGKIAKNKESLRGHVNYTHKATKVAKCETCHKEFKTHHRYTQHINKVHLGIRNNQCEICGKKFFANHDLKKHINMTHRGARPYVCQYCKKGFSSIYARKTHIRQHTNETPYRCEICTAGFHQKVSLVTHLKSKHCDVIKLDVNKKTS